ALTNRRWALILASIVLIAVARIATTYRVFSQTADEPIHLAAGYDFLKTGRQTSDPQHPPLARILFALPFLDTPPPAATDRPRPPTAWGAATPCGSATTATLRTSGARGRAISCSWSSGSWPWRCGRVIWSRRPRG